MNFKEIIQRLIKKDPEVTKCFFFWSGYTIEYLEELRRKDPIKAAKYPVPICNTCRPLLLRILHLIYGDAPFDYNEKVSDFYHDIIIEKIGQIRNPDNLMGWISTSAYNYFLTCKKKEDANLLEKIDVIPPSIEPNDIEDEKAAEARELVNKVLKAMPNRTYAMILDKDLDILQYTGAERIKKRKEVAQELGMSIDAFNMMLSRAKKQFKDIAEKYG